MRHIMTLVTNATEMFIYGPPATGKPPPLDRNLKLQKNGFSEAPQTSQVPRMVLGANFGKKIFWSHDPPSDPLTPTKRA